MGVMAARWGQIGQINVEILLASRAIVRRVRHPEIHRTPCEYIAKVVQRALPVFVARGQMPAAGAGCVRIVPAVHYDLRRWEVLDVCDTFGGVWNILTRSEHALHSFSRRLGPAV